MRIPAVPGSFRTIAVAAALIVSGCTSIQSVPRNGVADPASVLKAGDNVTCILRDGTHASFRVTAIEPTAIVGGEQRVAIADIQAITVERLDMAKTAKQAGMVTLRTVGTIVALLGYGAMGLALH